MSKTINQGVRLKLVTAGQVFVGKSSLLETFHSNTFKQIKPRNIGCEFQYHVVQKLWDTAGSERILSEPQNWFKGAAGLTLVYDITNRSSFEKIQHLVEQVFKINQKSCPAVILIGNKCDLEDKRAVSYSEGQELAESNGFSFMETSAKTAFNVQKAYDQLVNDMIDIF